MLHCYHNSFSWAPKQKQDFRWLCQIQLWRIQRKMVKARWTIIRVFQESPGAAPTSRCCAISMATSEVGSPLLTCLDSSAPLNHVGRRKFTSYRKRGKWRQHCVTEDLSDRPNSFQNSRNLCYSLWASLVAQTVKNLPVTQEMQFWSLGQGDPPGEGNGYPLQYSCLENPIDREPGRWQSMELQRAGHDWGITFYFEKVTFAYIPILDTCRSAWPKDHCIADLHQQDASLIFSLNGLGQILCFYLWLYC